MIELQASKDLIDDINRFKHGIVLYKNNSAIRYADGNDPAERIEYQKQAFAESQIDVVLKFISEGLFKIHHEAEHLIKEAKNA